MPAPLNTRAPWRVYASFGVTMTRYLIPLSLLVALGAMPLTAEAATGPARAGTHALERSGGRHSKPASRGGGRSQPSSRSGSRTPDRSDSRSDSHSDSRSDSRPDSNRPDSNRPDSNRADTNRPDSSRPDSSRPDSSRTDSSRGDVRPMEHQGARTADLSRGPSAPRSVEFGGPSAGSPGPRSPSAGSPSMPSNYRGATPVSRSPSGRSGADPASTARRSEHAEATARDHRDAAYATHSAVANDPRRDAAAAHRNAAARGRHAAAYHNSAAAYHQAYYDRSRHYSWYQPRGWFVRWAPGRAHYWYHGVFVYGPTPWGPPPPPGERAAPPPRHADHAGDLSIGLRGSSYGGAYKGGDRFGDLGLGLAARYRFNDPLGVEVQWVYHDDTWQEGTERIEQPLSASLELFALPWAKVNPYLLGGVTVTARNYQDHVGVHEVVENRTTWGPHAGVGLEFNLSERMSLNLDARYLAAVNLQPDDASRAGAVQGNLGLNFYF